MVSRFITTSNVSSESTHGNHVSVGIFVGICVGSDDGEDDSISVGETELRMVGFGVEFIVGVDDGTDTLIVFIDGT